MPDLSVDKIALRSCLPRESFNEWARKSVDFLNSQCEPASVLSTMHSLTLSIDNLMKKYYERELIAVVIFEAIKFCVSLSISSFDRRRFCCLRNSI